MFPGNFLPGLLLRVYTYIYIYIYTCSCKSLPLYLHTSTVNTSAKDARDPRRARRQHLHLGGERLRSPRRRAGRLALAAAAAGRRLAAPHRLVQRGHRRLRQEGRGRLRVATRVFELFELILLLISDEQLPVEQFEAKLSVNSNLPPS